VARCVGVASENDGCFVNKSFTRGAGAVVAAGAWGGLSAFVNCEPRRGNAHPMTGSAKQSRGRGKTAPVALDRFVALRLAMTVGSEIIAQWVGWISRRRNPSSVDGTESTLITTAQSRHRWITLRSIHPTDCHEQRRLWRHPHPDPPPLRGRGRAVRRIRSALAASSFRGSRSESPESITTTADGRRVARLRSLFD
jgi:hypothetical protein